jgi:hypothetical protein
MGKELVTSITLAETAQIICELVPLFQIVPTALLVMILCMDLTLAVEKQIKLEDIEREYTNSKQAQKQQQQQQQVNPQELVRDPQYTAHQQLNYPVQQQLQTYQPQLQFQTPPTAGAVPLYLTSNGFPGNYLSIVPDLAYVPTQHQSIPTGPQQVYLHPGGYTGFQFVQGPPTPLIYSRQQQLAAPETPEVAHSPTQSQVPTAPPPQQDFRVSQFAYQQPPTTGSAAYAPQQDYNPIPKELQSYTTIPEEVYQGKEPDFLYDQSPSVSLTHDGLGLGLGLGSNNALQQQQLKLKLKPQRPLFSSGVKSNGPPSPKAFANGGSFLVPTRHLPGSAISYSSYRQGPGSF